MNNLKQINRLFAAIFLIISFAASAVAQSDTSFWFVAPDMARNSSSIIDAFDRPVCFVVTAGDLPATVTMEMPAFQGFNNRVLTLNAHETQRIIFGDDGYTTFSNAQLDTIENNIINSAYVGIKHNRGIHFSSTAPVSLYYQLDATGSKELFVMRGNKALGTEFYTPFQTHYLSTSLLDAHPQFHIVATENNTTVMVTPTTDIAGTTAGTTKTVTLNRGETFAARTLRHAQGVEEDPATWLAGSHIEADKPVAVTVADDQLSVAGGDGTGDQLVPVNHLGTTYAVIRGLSSDNVEKIYILATEDNTSISIDGTMAGTLNKGQQYVHPMPTAAQTSIIVSDKPVYAYQLSGYKGEVGAVLLPSMYSINSRRITFYKSPSTHNQNIFVLVRDGNESYFTVNGSATVLQASDFNPVPNLAGWKYARKDISSLVTDGAVVVNNSRGAFSLGYFYTGTQSGSSASFGYFSEYGSLSFPDTTYKCPGEAITLDGGYGKSYLWTLPDGSQSNTSTITSSAVGRYYVIVDQDPFRISGTTVVLDRFDGAAIIPSHPGGVNMRTYTYGVDLKGQSPVGVSYVWKVNGEEVPAPYTTYTTYTATWNATDDNQQITVDLTDAATGCVTTLSYVHRLSALPDNIGDAHCRTDVSAFEWGIREIAMNPTTIDNYQQILTGDIDNDGEVEIIACMDGTSSKALGGADYSSNGLRMFVVRNDTVVEKRNWLFKDGGNNQLYASVFGSCAIARYNNEAYIVIAATDKYLYAFNYDGSFRWKSSQYIPNNNSTKDNVVSIADFNGDSIPEVWSGKCIFSLANGCLLVDGSTTGTANGKWGYTIAADMTGDGLPELVAGNQIFEITITNSLGTSGNSITLMTGGYQFSGTGLPTTIYEVDGRTHVADFDLDGELEVLVVTFTTNRKKAGAYLWKPNSGGGTGTLLGYYVCPVSNTDGGVGPALIGDIDADGYPEAVFISNGTHNGNSNGKMLMYALKYDSSKPAGNRLVEKWTFEHTDKSGATGMSLFDFNQDGKSEICYRDQTCLRIIDGSGTTPVVRNTFDSVSSGTLIEMPIIADVDNDGQAELVVSGDDGAFDYQQGGYLRVFKAPAGHKWAPARKVWNMYGYHALNVNNDLTIPARHISPATRFAGPNGTLNDNDDLRPFNNLFQQQTDIDLNGVPHWTLPDLRILSVSYDYYAVGDSLLIRIELSNTGDAPAVAPIYLTAYPGTPTVGTAIGTNSITGNMIPDSVVQTVIAVRNFSSLPPFGSLVVRINDQGEADYVQEECDYDYNSAAIPYTSLLLAHNDHVSTIVNMAVKVSVLANDSVPIACASSPNLSLVDPTKAVIEPNNDILYTPPLNFTGYDTVVYRITCSGDTSTARLCIYVAETPDNVSEVDCYVEPEAFAWSIREVFNSDTVKTHGNQYSTYVTPVVGDLNGDEIPEIVVARDTINVNLNRLYRNFHIYWGDNRGRYSIIHTQPGHFVGYGPAIARVEVNGTLTPLIVMVRYDNGYLYAYHPIADTVVWTSDQPVYGSRTNGEGVGYSLQFVDFGADGKVELLAANRIFDAATGKLLLDLGDAVNKGHSIHTPTSYDKYVPAAGDVDDDGLPEYVAGNQAYTIRITNNSDPNGNTASLLAQIPTVVIDGENISDGVTLLADINEDGRLDVLVSRSLNANNIGFYAWDVQTQSLIAGGSTPSVGHYHGTPFVGNVDTIPGIEILFTTQNKIKGFRYDGTTTFRQVYEQTVTDPSGATGITLFDFNQDGKSELVYRGEQDLRIMQAMPADAPTMGTFSTLYTALGGSGTAYEYPVVADVDNDGGAEIVTVAGSGDTGSLRIYKSDGRPWAPARRVWNQYSYNAVNINEDLTVPRYQVNPATVFPGKDGSIGTPDDVQPFNAFLQQQTELSKDGTPYWPTPDAVFDRGQTFVSRDGDSVSITICFTNRGDAALSDPVYATLYRDRVSVDQPDNRIVTGRLDTQVQPGGTACLTIGVPDINPFLPFTQLVVRLNDNDGMYPFQPECDCADSVEIRINPALDLMMKKNASLDMVQDNGTYGNPISVLYRDTIAYEIAAVNTNLRNGGAVIIRDTLPQYLRLKSPGVVATASVISGGVTTSGVGLVQSALDGTLQRDTIRWVVSNLQPFDTVVVRYEATPAEGASASQPLFVNKAWVQVSDTLLVQTNSTYHQGAGVAVVTFSALAGGSIYNAGEQALDYRTSPRAGVLVVPDSGYVFAGWRHDAYVPLRGEIVPADSGIMHYDTLTVYGNVELRAQFAPSGQKTPDKRNLTGNDRNQEDDDTDDNVWANKKTLYIRTKAGVTVRIYTLDGILQRQFVTTDTDLTTRRLDRGIYIVTLDGSAGRKIVISE